MGASIEAWIECDESEVVFPRFYPEKEVPPPFSAHTDFCIPLTNFLEFRSSKADRFFAAISGVRAQPSDPPPLFPLRGGPPPNVGGYTKLSIEECCDIDDPFLGYLSLSEIYAAMERFGLRKEDLNSAVNIVLDLMDAIEHRCGRNRTRLIFYIE